MSILVDLIMKNDRLKKMLYYPTRDCMDKPKVTDDQALNMFGKQIKIIPKLYVDGSLMNYLVISFDNFVATDNPEFRANRVEFDIICHFSQWQMKDFELRPYRIAAEIDSMLMNQRLTGIGEIEFLGATQTVLTDEYAGVCLLYRIVHGEEDKKHALNPEVDKDIKENFNAIFNEE